MIINYKGISYTIDQEEYESDDVFYKRMWFVAKQEPNSQLEMEEAIHNSIIWSNIKFLDCKYDQSILDKIKTIENKIIS